MTRTPRLVIADGLYHVTNRGLERGHIVRSDHDRRTWFRLFGRVATRCGWRVFAYALMDNHFHLFLRLGDPNLSSGMHDLESGYATLFNKNHHRNGPLFQDRFRAVLVENESHCGELTRYIHLNPVRARMVRDPSRYPWSSYRHYLNAHGAPDWLDWRTVLAEIASRESAARLAYKRFVEAGIEHPPANPLEGAIDGWILGSEEFARRCYASVESSTHRPDQRITVQSIIRAAAEHYGVDLEVLKRRGRHGNRAREAAILLSRELASESLATLSQHFGGVSLSAITETARRARQREQRDAAFHESVEQVRGQLAR